MPRRSLLELATGPEGADRLIVPSASDCDFRVGDIERELVSFGLSLNEARVYVRLAQHGPQKAREVSAAVGIHKTETYHLLTGLQNKGLVTATFQYPIEFIAEPFEKTLTILTNLEKEKLNALERKKPRLKSMWTSLPVDEPREEEKEGFQILEGPTRIYLRLKEMVTRAKRGVIGVGTERDFILLDEFDVLQCLRNLSRKGISCKVLLLGSTGADLSGMLKNIDVRVARCDISNPPHFLAVDSEEFLFFLNHGNVQRKSLCALWTNYKCLTDTMTFFFSSQWTNGNRETKKPQTSPSTRI